MVPLSTLSCGHNVYLSAQSFKHCSCCVRTPLVGFLGLWPHYVSKFPDKRCRPWLFLQTAFIPVPRCRAGAGKHKVCTYGAGGMAESRWAGTLSDVKITHFLGSIYFSLPAPWRIRNAQPLLHQQLDRWYCHGHMHVVKSQPRWPHTWRYAPSPCRALPWIHVLTVQMVNL